MNEIMIGIISIILMICLGYTWLFIQEYKHDKKRRQSPKKREHLS